MLTAVSKISRAATRHAAPSLPGRSCRTKCSDADCRRRCDRTAGSRVRYVAAISRTRRTICEMALRGTAMSSPSLFGRRRASDGEIARRVIPQTFGVERHPGRLLPRGRMIARERFRRSPPISAADDVFVVTVGAEEQNRISVERQAGRRDVSSIQRMVKLSSSSMAVGNTPDCITALTVSVGVVDPLEHRERRPCKFRLP